MLVNQWNSTQSENKQDLKNTHTHTLVHHLCKRLWNAPSTLWCSDLHWTFAPTEPPSSWWSTTVPPLHNKMPLPGCGLTNLPGTDSCLDSAETGEQHTWRARHELRREINPITFVAPAAWEWTSHDCLLVSRHSDVKIDVAQCSWMNFI